MDAAEKDLGALGGAPAVQEELASGSWLGQAQCRQSSTTKELGGFGFSTKALSGNSRKAENPALE